MSDDARAQLEREIRTAFDEGVLHRAATLALRGYGPEILGYLVVASGSRGDASEAFSRFCEDLWRGLPGFRWNASFRTWAYTLARHALLRMRRQPARKHGDDVPLDEAPSVFEVAQQVRTSTLVHLRTETKTAVMQLREQLAEEDRMLLVLRIDRQMSWQEIATIWCDDEMPSPDQLRRVAATCRKRFERVKERLRRLAQARGLI
jgi:RNA polymerase sigma-70 factor, ECF subfamily